MTSAESCTCRKRKNGGTSAFGIFTWLPFEQLFTLKRGDVTDGGEHVCTMGRRAFNAVSVNQGA
jgi:hypothetical protein